MLMRNKKGFTLIELVIIIVALGILVSVSIPKYKNIVADAREASCKGALGGLRSGVSIYYANQALVTGVTKGTIVGTRGGWAYNATSGEIWANTATAAGENNY